MNIDALLEMLQRGQDNPMLRFTLGQAYVNDKQWSAAITHLHKCLQGNPNYSAAWQLLGLALQQNGDLKQALLALEKGIAVADAQGDKQAQKVMHVYRKRVLKSLQEKRA